VKESDGKIARINGNFDLMNQFTFIFSWKIARKWGPTRKYKKKDYISPTYRIHDCLQAKTETNS
jgi:hypothetical protein